MANRVPPGLYADVRPGGEWEDEACFATLFLDPGGEQEPCFYLQWFDGEVSFLDGRYDRRSMEGWMNGRWGGLVPGRKLTPEVEEVARADVLLSPLTTQEAVLSSRIEGTQATMGEVFEYVYAIHALDWIFDRPIFRSTDFVSGSQIPDSTARRILGVFKDENLVKEIRPAAGRRPATLTVPRLLNIAEGRDVF